MASLTLEEMMPEIGSVFAVQESSLLNCMNAMTQSIARVEDEAKQRVSAAEIQSLRTKVRDAMDYVNEVKKILGRLEKKQETLVAEIDVLKRSDFEKEKLIEQLTTQSASDRMDTMNMVDGIEKKLMYMSKVKQEQKEMIRRLQRQEQAAAELKYGLTMLSSSINDENSSQGITPMSIDSKMEVITSVMSSRHSSISEPPPFLYRQSTDMSLHENSRSSFRQQRKQSSVIASTDTLQMVVDAMKKSLTPLETSPRSDVENAHNSDELTIQTLRRTSGALKHPLPSTPESVNVQNNTASQDKSPVEPLSSSATESLKERESISSLGQDKSMQQPAPRSNAKVDTVSTTSNEKLVAPGELAAMVSMVPSASDRSDAIEVQSSGATEEQTNRVASTEAKVAIEQRLSSEAPANEVLSTSTNTLADTETPVAQVPSITASVREITPPHVTQDSGELPHHFVAPKTSPDEQPKTNQSSAVRLEAIVVTKQSPVHAEKTLTSSVTSAKTNFASELSPPEPQSSSQRKSSSQQNEMPLNSSQYQALNQAAISTGIESSGPGQPRVRRLSDSMENKQLIQGMIREDSIKKDITTLPVERTLRRTSAYVVPEARTPEYYRLLWRWAICHIVALMRIHGLGVHKLLTTTPQPSVASRVRQIETTMLEFHTEVSQVQQSLDLVNQVRQQVESLCATTKSQHSTIGMLQQAQLQLQKIQLDQMEQMEAKITAVALSQAESLRPIETEPKVPMVPMELFVPFQDSVRSIEQSIARFDPFLMEYKAQCTANEKSFQMLGATQSSMSKVMEKDFNRVSEENKKRAVDLKCSVDSLANSLDAISQRIYQLLRFLCDVVHLTLSSEFTSNPLTSNAFRAISTKLRSDISHLHLQLTAWKGGHASSPLLESITKMDHSIQEMDNVKDKDFDKFVAVFLPVLHSLYAGLFENENNSALVRLVEEVLMEVQLVTSIAPLSVHLKRTLSILEHHELVDRELDVKLSHHSTALAALDQLQSIVKALGIKVEYVVNNTQTMIVEDDLKSVVSQLNAERIQIREQLEQAIRETSEQASEREESLQQDVSALAGRLSQKPDRQEMIRAHYALQEELERLTQSTATVEEVHQLTNLLKHKADVGQVHRFVNQKIATLQIDGAESHEAPLLATVKCLSCQNTVKAPEAAPTDRAPPLPFSPSCVRHVTRHKLDALAKRKKN